MNDLYDARNTNAHGLERKHKYYTCIQNLGSYQEIVRQAIRAFINTIDKLDYDKIGIYEIDMTKIQQKVDR
jgi:hypothetical protein